MIEKSIEGHPIEINPLPHSEKLWTLKSKAFRLSRGWIYFLFLALLAGAILRLIYVTDMEYKEDEEYNFVQTQLIGNTQPWPWYGIPSGVYLVNPGMSIWTFTVLAKIFGIHHPTSLAHAVQMFALLGICMIIPFALKFVKTDAALTWLWAFALAMVNPFLILYQRKLWPETFLPFFTMVTLMGWCKRKNGWGAFTWGMIGAWLGQIHMSGFFFSAALFLWTVFFDPYRNKESNPEDISHPKTAWKLWFLGSVIGALPLIPWLVYVIQHPIHEAINAGWNEVSQLKYWVFWFTDPLGLHLGNPLGLLRGQTNWEQISDFVRYPILLGYPTYLVGLAHLLIALAAAFLSLRFVFYLFHNKKHWISLTIGRGSDTAFLQNSAFWACGLLLTLTGVVIRRYYMTVTFPLEFIFLVGVAQPGTKLGRRILTLLWICEFFISAHFVGYIHVNQGSIYGDYGQAYHVIHPE